MSKLIHFRIDDDLFENLKKCSDELDLTIQECLTIALRQFIIKNFNSDDIHEKEYSFIDLFAGIGGMRLAFEEEGSHCIYSSEWDKFCQKTYFKNFGNQPEGDITQIKAENIPDHDILLAGFPTFKLELSENKSIEESIKNTAFHEIFRILKAKKPKAFMFECSESFINENKGETLKTLCRILKHLNYKYFYKTINSKSYVPQLKNRFIIVGFNQEIYKNKFDFSFDLKKEPTNLVLGDILEKDVSSKYILSDRLWNYYKKKNQNENISNGLAPVDGMAKALTPRYYKDGFDILINQEKSNPRRLTPRECARLQGFPDSFDIPVSDTQAYKQFANSAVVPMIKDVAKLVINKLKELDEEKDRIYEVEYVI